MGIFIEFLARLFTLDIAWFVAIILNNLLWVFAFIALAHFFFRKKPLYISFPIVIIYLWSSFEFANLFNWEVLTAGFLAFTYLARVAGLTFAASIDSLKNRLSLVSTVLFVSTLAIWNLSLV